MVEEPAVEMQVASCVRSVGLVQYFQHFVCCIIILLLLKYTVRTRTFLSADCLVDYFNYEGAVRSMVTSKYASCKKKRAQVHNHGLR